MALLCLPCFCHAQQWPHDKTIGKSLNNKRGHRKPWLQNMFPSKTTNTKTTNTSSMSPPPFISPLLPESIITGSENKEKETRDDDMSALRSSILKGALEPTTSPTALLSFNKIKAILKHADPAKLSRWGATGLQIGLLLYLGRAIYRAASDVVQEYAQEMAGTDPAYVKLEDVQRVIQFFEQDPDIAAASLQAHEQGNNKLTTTAALPPMAALQLAQKLAVSGLPLRSNNNNTSSSEEGAAVVSVESVLSSLTRSEATLLQQCMWTPHPSQVHHSTEALRSSWNNIAGLESAKERLLSSLATVKGRHSKVYAPLFDNSNTAAGILLYGPPGCGKTLLVKALAQTARLPCLVITPSVLLRKYVGETNLQVRSLFSLANKLAPCVLCIDELDGLFRERSENEHEVSRDLKTEFLQWWDGMLSSPADNGKQILVVGATNRPFDVDSAVLRRLPQSQFVGLPDQSARLALLKQLLRHVPTEKSLNVEHIASVSEGYSPSDIRQLLQTAALTGPLRDASYVNGAKSPPRALTTQDIVQAFQQVPPTPMSQQYRSALSNFARFPTAAAPPPSDSVQMEANWGNFYNAGTLQLDHESFDEYTDMVYEMDDEPSDVSLDEEEEEEASDDGME